jgi:acetolactate synthase I/II/III large subunit
MGALGLHCTSNDEFGEALDKALAAERPAVIQVMVSPSQISAWAS